MAYISTFHPPINLCVLWFMPSASTICRQIPDSVVLIGYMGIEVSVRIACFGELYLDNNTTPFTPTIRSNAVINK
jgi:hypothetical protein